MIKGYSPIHTSCKVFKGMPVNGCHTKLYHFKMESSTSPYREADRFSHVLIKLQFVEDLAKAWTRDGMGKIPLAPLEFLCQFIF